MIKPPVGLNGTELSDPSLIQPPGSPLADWGPGSLPIAGDAATPDSPGPDLVNGGLPDDLPIDRAEQAASIAGPGNALKTIGTEASRGSDATAGSAVQFVAAGSADSTPSGAGSAPMAGPSGGYGSAVNPIGGAPAADSGAAAPVPMAAGGGLVININYDSSVDSAPAAFKSGVTAAVQQLEGLFTNVSVTLTIDVGYGEVNGQALSPDNLGQSDTFLNLVVYDYSQVRAALVAEGAPGSSTLPATSPSPGAGIPATSFAQGKALGIGADPNNTNGRVDGAIGFSSILPFSYANGVTPSPNEYYFIGVVEHEITEVMGRYSGATLAGTVMDLFRYSAPGVRDFTTGGTGSTAYFSLNNGTTNLGTWNNDPRNGDLGDWFPSGPAPGGNDALNDFSKPGVINAFSQTDVTLMEAIGWEPSGSSPSPSPPPPPPPTPLPTPTPTPLPTPTPTPIPLPTPLSPLLLPTPLSPLLLPTPLAPLLLLPTPLPPLLLPAPLPPLLLPPSVPVLPPPPPAATGNLITVGAGPQTVIGGVGDTIIGGSGPNLIDGLAGSGSIIGGSGATTVWGGVGDTIAAGSGDTYVDGTGGGMAIAVGSGGTDIIVGSTVSGGGDTLTGGTAVAQIQSLGNGDVVNFAAQTGNATINAIAGNIRVTLGGGPATVYGGVGDMVNLGSVGQYVDGTAGGIAIAVGSSGTDTIIGSTARAPGTGVDTLTGGAAAVQIQSLGNGDVVSFAAQTGAATINATAGNIAVTLGGGPATVYGGLGDAINLGSVSQYADGTAGDQAIAVGSGGTDIIIGSTLAAGSGVDILTGGAAAAEIQGLGKGDIVDFSAQTGAATINATAGNIAVTLGGGPATVYGGLGDAINFGSASQYADGTAGRQTIAVGSGGTDLVIGSMVSSAGDTITGGSAALNYNVGAGDDLVNLAGSSGAATVNAVGADTGPVNDTVIASNGGDSVWGGKGDRIGVGASASGTDLFTHATTIPGAAIGFGTNDAAVAATYGGTAGAVTVNSAVPGASAAQVSVGGFAENKGTPTDFVFYPGESSATSAAIVATSTQIIVNGAASTQFTLPDGTQMTLLGIPQADFNTAFFKP